MFPVINPIDFFMLKAEKEEKQGKKSWNKKCYFYQIY